MKTIQSILLVTLLPLALGACAGKAPTGLKNSDPSTTDPPVNDDPTTTSISNNTQGGVDNTFNHMGGLGGEAERDAFDILAQRQEEGPPEIRTRLHSCQKIQIAAVANMLSAFGVDLGAKSDPPSAGELLKSGGGALGAANYDSRTGESITWSSAGAAKLFDVFVQAAPEIIANMANVDQCKYMGKGTDMFDAQNNCSADGVTCLIGRPATPEHIAICSSLVQSASDLDKGKAIAVASLLSAAHSCE